MMKYILLGFILITSNAYSQYAKEIKIKTLLKADTNLIGQKFHYPQGDDSEITILRISIPPGETTGWHMHPYPVFGVMLKGVLTVEIEGEKPFDITAGDANAEVVNKVHRGVNNGKEEVEIIAFYPGKKGTPLVIKK